MKHLFEIILLEEAADFIDQLDEKTKYKLIYNLNKAQLVQNITLFKKLRNEIWEFRTYYNTTYYRLFAFWGKSNKYETLVISTHGIIKKTAKINPIEIEKAERMRIEYFNLKIK